MTRTIRAAVVALGLCCGLIGFTGAAHAEAPIEVTFGAGDLLSLDGKAEAIYIADPDIADVQLRSPKLVYLFGKGVGETTLTVVGKNDAVILSRRILVRHNTIRLGELIDTVHPGTTVGMASIGASLVLTGEVASAEIAADIVEMARAVVPEGARVMNRLSVSAPNQVNLRVRIAEVSRDTTKRLGFSWDILKTAGDFSFGLATGGFVSGAGSGSSILSLAKTGNGFDVNGLIDALDDEGLITVLAEPNLTAQSGESADFLAGGEFPIPVAADNDTVTIVFKRFGVSLSFLPVVLDGGRLHIKVSTEVSQLSSAGAIELNGFNVPSLTVREATTTVNLGSGQSFAIAGLLQNTTNNDLSGVAGLKDLPILGALFRSSDFQRAESELVVIVTPYLVRPVSTQLALPTDGYRAPTDAERVADAATHSPRLPDRSGAPVTADGQTGPLEKGGFILR